MENDLEKNKSLSAEQQEQKDKFSELLGIIYGLPDSFGDDSNKAYEVASSINDFFDNFKDKDLKLKDYLLGGILLNPRETLYKPDVPYDTNAGEIEEFIRSLDKQYNKNIE